MIFKIEEEDLFCEDCPVEASDVGKYVIVFDGIVCGTFSSLSEAESHYRDAWFNFHS